MLRPPRPVAALSTSLLLLLSACSRNGDDSAQTETSADPTTSVSTASDPDPDPDPHSTSTSDARTGAVEETDADEAGEERANEPEPESESEPEPEEPAADVVISGALRRGELQVDDRRFDVPLGSSVLITFESDETEHIHLHGYDLLVDLEPGVPVELSFVADSPGSFEVELEDSGRFLFELLVR